MSDFREGDDAFLKCKIFRADSDQALIEFTYNKTVKIRVPVSELVSARYRYHTADRGKAAVMPDTSEDPVNHPKHYGGHLSGVECIDVTRLLSFNLGNAVKYVWRAEKKNGTEDFEKALWYMRDAKKSGQGFLPDPVFQGIFSRVIGAEPVDWKRRFYLALMVGNTTAALNVLEEALGA